jgi:hypothetical protein
VRADHSLAGFCNTIPPIATKQRTSSKVAEGPEGDIKKLPVLFDHLVGATRDGQGDADAKRFGGLEIDEQLDFSSLLDW